MSGRRSLHDRHPDQVLVPGLIVATSVLLGCGLILPVVETERLGISSRYSVLGGIVQFYKDGSPLLGTVVLFFSALFPTYKLASLVHLWFQRVPSEFRERALTRLEALGKWSMLDVFIVVVLIGTLNLGMPADARALPGVYVFAAAILLSMLATFLTARAAGIDRPQRARASSPSRWIPVLAMPSLALLAAGLSLPLMETEKWVFWDREFSILRGAAEMARAGEVPLAVFLVVFVALLPLAGAGVPLVVWWRSRSGAEVGRLGVWSRRLERWAMADVFALAMVVVTVKLWGLVSIQPLLGMWLLGAGILLASALSWVQRRSVRSRRRAGRGPS